MSSALQGSIIIPVLNEASTIAEQLRRLREQLGTRWELIVVDGGSSDATAARASPHCDHLVQSLAGRSRQMNAGAAVAAGQILVFLHADTRLPADFERQMQAFLTAEKGWGRFDVQLDDEHPMLRIIGGMMNLRSRLTGIATGDQTFFVRREFFSELQGFREIPLMEDVDFSRRACRRQRPFCSRSRVITSARKWQRNGIFRTMALMWWIRLAYFVGISPATLHRWYYPPK